VALKPTGAEQAWATPISLSQSSDAGHGEPGRSWVRIVEPGALAVAPCASERSEAEAAERQASPVSPSRASPLLPEMRGKRQNVPKTIEDLLKSHGVPSLPAASALVQQLPPEGEAPSSPSRRRWFLGNGRPGRGRMGAFERHGKATPEGAVPVSPVNPGAPSGGHALSGAAAIRGIGPLPRPPVPSTSPEELMRLTEDDDSGQALWRLSSKPSSSDASSLRPTSSLSGADKAAVPEETKANAAGEEAEGGLAKCTTSLIQESRRLSQIGRAKQLTIETGNRSQDSSGHSQLSLDSICSTTASSVSGVAPGSSREAQRKRLAWSLPKRQAGSGDALSPRSPRSARKWQQGSWRSQSP